MPQSGKRKILDSQERQKRGAGNKCQSYRIRPANQTPTCQKKQRKDERDPRSERGLPRPSRGFPVVLGLWPLTLPSTRGQYDVFPSPGRFPEHANIRPIKNTSSRSRLTKHQNVKSTHTRLLHFFSSRS